MKRFLASDVLVSAMLLGLFVMLSPASLALATTTGERSQSVAPIAHSSSITYKAAICVQWANEKRCSNGETHKAGTGITITASAQPAPVAPWRLVMMTKEIAPRQGMPRVQMDCGKQAQCHVSGSAHGPGAASYWACVTDASSNLAAVCSKAGPHAILSNPVRAVVS